MIFVCQRFLVAPMTSLAIMSPRQTWTMARVLFPGKPAMTVTTRLCLMQSPRMVRVVYVQEFRLFPAARSKMPAITTLRRTWTTAPVTPWERAAFPVQCFLFQGARSSIPTMQWQEVSWFGLWRVVSLFLVKEPQRPRFCGAPMLVTA